MQTREYGHTTREFTTSRQLILGAVLNEDISIYTSFNYACISMLTQSLTHICATWRRDEVIDLLCIHQYMLFVVPDETKYIVASEAVARWQVGRFNYTVRSQQRHSVWNGRQPECFSYSMFRLITTKTSKIWVAGSLWGRSICDWWFSAQTASIEETVSMSWWPHVWKARRIMSWRSFSTACHPWC